MKYYDSEVVSGTANTITYGGGLTSTEVSKKKLDKIYIITDSRNGNYAEIWLEKERVGLIHDSLLSTKSDNPKIGLEMDIEIPVGQTLLVANRCGGTASDMTVVYEYEEAT